MWNQSNITRSTDGWMAMKKNTDKLFNLNVRCLKEKQEPKRGDYNLKIVNAITIISITK